MTAQTARLLVDGNGQIIPNQYYDVATNRFKASEDGTGISSASPIDRSSTITTGGAAQNAVAALATRKAYFFQNISSESMWASFTGTAAPSTVGSFEIVPNGVIRSTTTCETTALSIYGATTGQKYTMWEM